MQRLAEIAIRRGYVLPRDEQAPTANVRDQIDFGVTSGRTLLQAPHRRSMMMQVYDLCGINREHFEAVYVSAAEQCAAYVQSLPASEHHHHSRTEGLLDHALETTVAALRLRQAYLLPPNSEPEVVRWRSDVWTYGVFLAALFHDVGKAATDHEVELIDEDGASLGYWPALAGPMAAPFYRAKFRSERSYTHHQKLSAVVMRPLLPAAALEWLFSDTDLTVQLIEFLSGETKGVLAQIVREADMGSARESLAGDSSPITDNKQSLPARLLSAFRELLDNGRLPVNKPGAAAWVTQTDVWLVSKRAIDTARDHIRTVSGFVVPKDNQACMNELQAAQICVATDKDKAIWRVEVRDGEWSKSLSFLRISNEKMWPRAGDRPAVFSGEIISPGETDRRELADVAGKDELPPEHKSEPSLPEQAPDSPVTESADVFDPEVEPSEEALVATSALSEPENAQGKPAAELPEPQGFYAWMTDGIASGKLTLNVANAPLHVVKDGLFMVSPRIFKRYAQNNNRWKRVQRKVIQDGVVLKSAEGANIIKYVIQGERRESNISGMVIVDPEAVLDIALPPENKLFQCVTPV